MPRLREHQHGAPVQVPRFALADSRQAAGRVRASRDIQLKSVPVPVPLRVPERDVPGLYWINLCQHGRGVTNGSAGLRQ